MTWPVASCIPQPSATVALTTTPVQQDRMTAALMTELRDRRHLSRPELESERNCRAILARMLEVAAD